MNAHRYSSVHKSQDFSLTLHHHLVKKGIQPHIAAAVSAALVHAARYAYDHPLETLEDAHTVKESPEAWRVLRQAQHLGSNTMMIRPQTAVTLSAKVAASRASIAAAGLLIIKTSLELAGFPVNKCVMSFSTVAIDAAEVLSGSLAAETVVGGVFAAISAHAASGDSMELVANCFGIPKEKQEQTQDEASSMRTVMYRP
jgi:hypothetical protein